MSTFRGQTVAAFYDNAGNSIYGESQYALPVMIRVSVITMKDLMQQSPIRSEASGSHGRVDQSMGMVKVLFPPNVPVSVYDRLDVLGAKLEVISVFPRQDLYGRLQHFEATLRPLTV